MLRLLFLLTILATSAYSVPFGTSETPDVTVTDSVTGPAPSNVCQSIKGHNCGIMAKFSPEENCGHLKTCTDEEMSCEGVTREVVDQIRKNCGAKKPEGSSEATEAKLSCTTVIFQILFALQNNTDMSEHAADCAYLQTSCKDQKISFTITPDDIESVTAACAPYRTTEETTVAGSVADGPTVTQDENVCGNITVAILRELLQAIDIRHLSDGCVKLQSCSAEQQGTTGATQFEINYVNDACALYWNTTESTVAETVASTGESVHLCDTDESRKCTMHLDIIWNLSGHSIDVSKSCNFVEQNCSNEQKLCSYTSEDLEQISEVCATPSK